MFVLKYELPPGISYFAKEPLYVNTPSLCGGVDLQNNNVCTAASWVFR